MEEEEEEEEEEEAEEEEDEDENEEGVEDRCTLLATDVSAPTRQIPCRRRRASSEARRQDSAHR